MARGHRGFMDTSDLGQGKGTVKASGIRDCFVNKLDGAGATIWANTFGGIAPLLGVVVVRLETTGQRVGGAGVAASDREGWMLTCGPSDQRRDGRNPWHSAVTLPTATLGTVHWESIGRINREFFRTSGMKGPPGSALSPLAVFFG